MEHRGLVWVLLVLVGCTPAPTPLPVQPVVTTTPANVQVTPIVTEAPTLRYGVLPNAADCAPLDVIRAAGITVEIAVDGVTYDIVAGYGLYDGWEMSTVPQAPVALMLNTNLPPLDEPGVAMAVQSAIRPDEILTTLDIPGSTSLYTPPINNSRTQLANAGYPAGIMLYGRVGWVPGAEAVLAQLEAAGVQVTLLDDENTQTHLTLGQQNQPDAQPLYMLPLSYTAPSDISITFTDDGWPLPVR